MPQSKGKTITQSHAKTHRVTQRFLNFRIEIKLCESLSFLRESSCNKK